ncbi:uncharacterized protein BO88DRAFT_427290 [Aspergillus vadensis CBS 113365]|uniref:Uncharacterized protein n=1 Tax=Aspergillus vadensis (strain CBS 113365 / IMI 142717 / IBT 24658) TaxID=1448311 RepID=A0A319CFK9_ASPVC|nr:hypothetical protein BO88DRAFT_427290 [Aspergillus vadensis CBS 113365]PYH67132.1 hypothetical protein BO88DRAFT_427290 [Aspergillus vadensis CBS 113365]
MLLAANDVVLITPVPPLSILYKGRRPTESPVRHNLPEINKYQEDENRFFYTCLKIFDDLAAVAVEVSDNLILQHEFEPEVSLVGNRRIPLGMRKLQETLSNSHRKKARAREEWNHCLNLLHIHALLPQWI